MPYEQQNIPDLAKEKLLLEIEELKTNIATSKKSKAWEAYIKPIIPVAVTLIIAIFGSIITAQFNSSQLEITKSKNQSDKELAQINASLSYIKLMSDISDSSFQLQKQAKIVIATILPPEASFNLAVSELPNNPSVLKVLFNKYDRESWNYIAPYLEFLSINKKSVFVRNRNPQVKTFKDIDYNSYNLDISNSDADSMFRLINNTQTQLKGENIRKKFFILNFLEGNQMLNSFFQFLISDDYKSQKRLYSLINYLDYIYHNPEFEENLARRQKIFEEFSTLIDNTKDYSLKIDLFLSTALVFKAEDKYERKGLKFIYSVASHFWDDLDVSKGETPTEGSVKNILYEDYFQGKNQALAAILGLSIVQSKLFEKLSKLDLSKMDNKKIRAILNSYCERDYHETTSASYLRPAQICLLINKILLSRKTCEQKRDMAFFLGSGSTIMLYESLSQDSKASRQFVEHLVNWYENNHGSLKSCDKEYGVMVLGEMVLGEMLRTLKRVSEKYPDLKKKLEAHERQNSR